MSERNIWASDPDALKAAFEEGWWALGRDYLYGVHAEAHALLSLPRLPRGEVEAVYRMRVGRVIAKADTAAQRTARENAYSRALKRFRNIRARGFSPPDAREISELLTEKWYAEGRLETRAQSKAVRGFLAGYIREHPSSPRPPQAPVTWQEAQTLYRFDEGCTNALSWAQAHAAEHVTHLKERTRHRLAGALLTAQGADMQPLTTARSLLETFGTLNRDWRMVAITEAASNHAHGQLAGLIGEKVKWVAAADACKYCEQYDSQEFVVVSPGVKEKDFFGQVWAGKTNVGRSFHSHTREGRARTLDELAGPAIPSHPNCRCRFQRVLAKPQVGAEFEDYLRRVLAA